MQNVTSAERKKHKEQRDPNLVHSMKRKDLGQHPPYDTLAVEGFVRNGKRRGQLGQYGEISDEVRGVRAWRTALVHAHAAEVYLGRCNRTRMCKNDAQVQP